MDTKRDISGELVEGIGDHHRIYCNIGRILTYYEIPSYPRTILKNWSLYVDFLICGYKTAFFWSTLRRDWKYFCKML
jgi:hypothetical protein